MKKTASTVCAIVAFAQAAPVSESCPSNADPGPGEPSVFVNRSSSTIWPWLQYQTEPTFNPPFFNVTGNGQQLSDGLVFIAPNGSPEGTKQFGGIIMTDQGDLVWNGPTVPANNPNGAQANAINNFRVQTLNGTEYITYWEGYNTNGANVGHGYGAVNFVDHSYTKKFSICPKLSLVAPGAANTTCQSDIHEQLVTSRGTLLVSAYNQTNADLSAVGGPKNGSVFDSMFFELSIPNGDILFKWSSLAHAPLNSSHLPLQGAGNSSNPWDFFHINSVEYVPDLKAYLVNGRHTWTTYLVDEKDGHVIWQINGETGGDFGTLPSDGHFHWQHDARVAQVDSESVSISWFNNYNSMVDNGTMPTNGLKLQLPLPPNKSVAPKLLEHLTVTNDPIYADSQGRYGFQPSDSNFTTQFMAYGQVPILREFGTASDGSDLRYQARFGHDTQTQSYRGYKQIWTGEPSFAPKLVVHRNTTNGCQAITGYASWNGATNISAWAIYEGADKSTLKQSGTVQKNSFETKFTPATASKCVQVAAVENGKEAKRSNVVCT